MGLADITKRVIVEIILDDKASKGIDELDGTTKSAGASMAAQFAKIAAKVTLITAAVTGVVVAIDKMATRLGNIEKMRVDFDKLTKSMGTDSVTAMTKLKEASRGVVSEFDLLESSNRIMLQGIVGTDDELANVVKIADRLGNQTLTTTQRVEEFTQLLRNQSVFMLDNFGISSGKVRDRIQELQEEFPGMTRDVAFTTATLEEADKNMQLLGATTNTTSDDITRLKVQFTNIKDEVLVGLAPAFSFLVGVVEFVIEAYKKAYNFLKPIFEPVLQEIADGVDDVKKEFIELLDLLGMDMDDFIEVLTTLAAITVGPVLFGLMVFAKAIAIIIKAIKNMVEMLKSAVYWTQTLVGKRDGLDWKETVPVGDIQYSGSFATGGISTGGMTLVGEAGPELVKLPRGSHVYNNDETNKMMGGGDITINVNAPVTGVDNLKASIIEAVNEATARQNRLANYNLL